MQILSAPLRLVFTAAYFGIFGPALGLLSFFMVAWIVYRRDTPFPFSELPGFYIEAGLPTLGCGVLFALALLAWTKGFKSLPNRLTVAAIGSLSMGVVFGYQFAESLIIRSHFSKIGALIAALGMSTGAILGFLIPRKLLPLVHERRNDG